MSKFSRLGFFDDSRQVVVAESGVIPVYNGKNLTNVKPVTQRVDFTSSDSSVCTWDGTVATIVHTMNCIPVVSVFTSYNEQLYPTVTIVSANSIQLDFGQSVTGAFYAIINYGTEWGDPTAISSTLATYVEQAATAATAAETAKGVAQNAAATAVANSIQLDFKINADEELIMTKMAGNSFDFDVDADGNLVFSITM